MYYNLIGSPNCKHCSLPETPNRVAQNEEIFEKCVSLCGLVFLLVQRGMKKCFLKK